MLTTAMTREGQRAAFLDRDGTLNVRPPEHEYVRSPEEFHWIPGAREGAARLASLGFVLVVVSNQQGVALGLVPQAALRAIEARIQSDLAPHGCHVESFLYCVHSESEGCDCRKPRPGLLNVAQRRLGLDPAQSWMIGDSTSDVAAGRSAGCRTALIGGSACDGWRTAASRQSMSADFTATDLLAASELIARSTS